MLDLIFLDTEDLIDSPKVIPNNSLSTYNFIIVFDLMVGSIGMPKSHSPQYMHNFGRDNYPAMHSF